MAKRIEEGPTNGTTCIPFRAKFDYSARICLRQDIQLSATFLPSNKGWMKSWCSLLRYVCSKTKELILIVFSGCTSLIDLRAVFHSQQYSNQ
jgi:hypothetical protein